MRRVYLFIEENSKECEAFKPIFIETYKKYEDVVDFVILKMKEDRMSAKWLGVTSAPTLVMWLTKSLRDYWLIQQVKKTLL